MVDTIRRILEDLTGQEASFPESYEDDVNRLLSCSGIGYSQLNELLLLLGDDRMTPAFFQLLIDLAPDTGGLLRCVRLAACGLRLIASA